LRRYVAARLPDRDLDLLIERVGAMRGNREFFNRGD